MLHRRPAGAVAVAATGVTFTVVAAIALAGGAGGAASTGNAGAGGMGLLRPAPDAVLPPLDVQDDDAPGLVRSRAVRLSFESLPRLTSRADGSHAVSADVELNLFEDVHLTAHFDRFEQAIPAGPGGAPQAMVFSGRLAGEESSRVYLSICGDSVVGDVFSATHGTFEVRPAPGAGEGVFVVREMDASIEHGCGTTEEHHVHGLEDGGHGHEHAPAGGGEAPAPRVNGAATGPVMDVLCFYTPSVLAQVGGNENTIIASIASWQTQTNDAYAGSEIKATIRIVGLEITEYVETSSASQDLSNFRFDGDGNMDEVHQKRNAYGADMMHLVSRSPGVCGIAYLMTGVGPGFESSCFGVTIYSCGALTFAHELGHNQGSAHDHDNGSSAAFCYGFGYRTPNNQFRTIMAYAPGSRVPMFSNPNVNWGNFAMGVDGNGCPSDAAHNARSINNTMETVAAFRESQSNPNPPAPFSLILPADGETGTSIRPTLSWQFSPNATQYDVIVSSDEALEVPLFEITRYTSHVQLPPGILEYDHEYFWGVNAVGFAGEQTSMPFARSFRTRALADFNGDGVIGSVDLAALIGAWGVCPEPPFQCLSDIDGDNVVGAMDLAIMLGAWGE